MPIARPTLGVTRGKHHFRGLRAAVSQRDAKALAESKLFALHFGRSSIQHTCRESAARGSRGYSPVMKLDAALKTSLDELRMQMLGTQVLLGFQFQGLFQENFPAVGVSGRSIDAVGIASMVVALGLMMAIPCQHRLIEGGQATQRIYRASKRYAELALFPLACGIGCDVFVAIRGSFGAATGTLLAVAAFAAALCAWYVLGSVLRRHWEIPGGEVPMKETETPLHTKIDQMLTEGRVILPGAQALLGFQFVVMLTKAFGELTPAARVVHLVALLSITLSVVLLIAPTAIHRLTFGGRDDPRMHATGSLLMTVALLPLAFGLTCDTWVALTRLFAGHDWLALYGALGVLVLLMTLWYLVPLMLRRAYREASVP
jgi:hypothetical protein